MSRSKLDAKDLVLGAERVGGGLSCSVRVRCELDELEGVPET
jgi:hypothetical protein